MLNFCETVTIFRFKMSVQGAALRLKGIYYIQPFNLNAAPCTIFLKNSQKKSVSDLKRNQLTYLKAHIHMYAFEIDIICSMSPLVEQINFELS